KNKDVQIEINESITNEQADYWKSLGITQLIYHRSNEVVDKEEKWNPQVLEKISSLAKKDINLSVTGGLTVEENKLFKDIPVYCYRTTRKIYNSDIHFQIAKEYKKEIIHIFN